MPGFNPENINIHDLTIEEPEKQAELLFDPERDITKEDWAEINGYLEHVRNLNPEQNHTWHLVTGTMSPMKILGEEVSLSKNEKEHVSKMLEDISTHSAGFLNYASNVKIIEPTTKFEVYGADWVKIELMIKENRYDPVLEKIAEAKIVDPNRVIIDIHEYSIRENGVNYSIEEHLENSLKNARADKNGWARLAENLAWAKIIGHHTEIRLTKDDWKAMKNQLNGRRPSWIIFLEFAAAMKIIAAEEVNVTDKGLEIIMPGQRASLQPEASEVPEQRKF